VLIDDVVVFEGDMCDAWSHGFPAIDVLDLSWFSGSYSQSWGQGWFHPEADLNNDGKVDVLDLSGFSGNYGKRYHP
jgi:hypothetical protein